MIAASVLNLLSAQSYSFPVSPYSDMKRRNVFLKKYLGQIWRETWFYEAFHSFGRRVGLSEAKTYQATVQSTKVNLKIYFQTHDNRDGVYSPSFQTKQKKNLVPNFRRLW